MAAVLGSAIVFLDSTVVNVALPRMGRELPRLFVGVLEGQQYVINFYLLSLCAVIILAGALTDYYGRKRVFTVGLVGFGAISVLCGLAPTMEILIAARLLQGLAGAFLVPGSLAILTATFEGEEQGRAFGVWAGASAGTTILGPFVGGVLVDGVSWRAAFLINVPLIALAVYATVRHVRESRDEEASSDFDWRGAALIAMGLGGMTFGGIFGGQHGFSEPAAFIPLTAGIACTIAFPFVMARTRHPLVPLSLFQSRNFSVTNISTFLIYGALYVVFGFLGLFAQGTIGYTAAAAGLVGIPGTIFLVLFSPRFGALAARFGPRWFMAIGPLIMAIGVSWYIRLPSTTSAWLLVTSKPSTYLPPAAYAVDFLPGAVIFGVGLMMMVAPLTTALMTSVPVHNSGLASAINNAISRVGPIVAGTGIFIALTSTFYGFMAAHQPGIDFNSPTIRHQVSPLNPAPANLVDPGVVRQASTDSFHLAMVVGVALLLSGGAINAVGIRNQKPAGAEAEAGATPTQAAAATPD